MQLSTDFKAPERPSNSIRTFRQGQSRPEFIEPDTLGMPCNEEQRTAKGFNDSAQTAVTSGDKARHRLVPNPPPDTE